MSKKEKIIALAVCFFAIILFILYVLLTYGFTKKKSTEELHDPGNLHVEEPSYLYDDNINSEYVKDADQPEEEVNIIILGVYDLQDCMTIQALNDLYPAARAFLDQHGYANCTTLTVQLDTIIADKSYPLFICTMDSSGDQLEVRYDISKHEFEFSIIYK